ncbi:hypothetical protein FDUTEX481_06299 [Tolypothrix sp. PCC 7601]|nr:hypothetical protein FDUTEX481_06299 [Tolypothrix sp. PCC 7601]
MLLGQLASTAISFTNNVLLPGNTAVTHNNYCCLLDLQSAFTVQRIVST